MTVTRRKPFRSRWAPKPKPEPVDTARTKALRLPRPGPGLSFTVPLHLEPTYLEIYQLVPLTPGEVMQLEEKLKIRKPAGVLWVKRIKNEQ